MNTSCKLLAAVLTLLAGQAMAAPITFGFSGDIRTVTDSEGNSINYGSSWFKGSVTFDPARAPTEHYVDEYVEVNSAGQDYGCFSSDNGICTDFYGPAATPVIIEFKLETAVGKYSAKPDASGGYVSNGVSKIIGIDSSENRYEEAVFSLLNNRTKLMTAGPDFGGTINRQNVVLNFLDAVNVFDDFLDFTELPASTGNFSFSQENLEASCLDSTFAEDECTITPIGDNFALEGTVTEVHRVDATDIPEPASLAIMVLGLVGIGAVRRSK